MADPRGLSGPEPPDNAIDRLARRVGEVVAYVFFVSMAIIAYEVIARYVFNAPTVWAHDLTTTLSAVGFVISGAYTLQRRQHIRISFVYDKMSAPARRLLDLVNGAIIIVFLGLLGYQAVLDAYKSVSIMETAGTASRLPLPPIIKTALLVAVVLMFLVAIGQWLRVARDR